MYFKFHFEKLNNQRRPKNFASVQLTLTAESRFFEPPRETKIDLKKSELEKSKVKSTEIKSKENEFWFKKIGNPPLSYSTLKV